MSFDEEMKHYNERLSALREEVKAGTKSKAELKEFKKQNRSIFTFNTTRRNCTKNMR